MIYPLKQLIGCELRCRANTLAGSVAGFVIDDEAWSLPYVRVRLSWETQATDRLLPSLAFPPPSEFTGAMVACLTPEELSHGLPLTGACEELSRKAEIALHDTLHWRPYWFECESWVPHPLHDAAVAIGARLSRGGEPFGNVEDLLVDTGRWTVHALHVRVTAGRETELIQLPLSSVRSTNWATARFDSDECAATTSGTPVSSLQPQGTRQLEGLRRQPSGHRTRA